MHNLSVHSQWRYTHRHRIQLLHVVCSSTYCLIAILLLLHEFYCKHSHPEISMDETVYEEAFIHENWLT